ncbi:phospholipase A [Luteimonas sp. RD2P54]|uniref:Phospholipase A1 n=2 Tax=Luteimonas endophytica TaxID=3042023 RepID=A0ABT6JC49_9GAMM|nr:phospholipase A [Luteimonas endophytica]MDH5824384.1 phospholipase A [Luteimonas endophytica]
MRLACYDEAMQRTALDPATADAAAEQARQVQDSVPAAGPGGDTAVAGSEQAAANRLSELFAHDDSDPIRAAIANVGKGSLLDTRWELARDSKLGLFNFRAYKPVYLLPAFWTTDTNPAPRSPNPDNTVTEPAQIDNLEAKFQLSFKTKALENLFGDNGDLWMGYTQSSRWQIYNSESSRPFRETNYEPEILLVFRNGYSLPGGWHGRMSAIGINHQSNGREDPLSRSWNRVMFNFGFDREDWALMVRPWVRISDGSDDDNPDIEDYMGRGDLTLVHVRGGHQFSLMARHSLRGGDRSHGALQFDWGFPIHRAFRGHVQLFDGYGESLIDYNHRATYIGLGISLQEWF